MCRCIRKVGDLREFNNQLGYNIIFPLIFDKLTMDIIKFKDQSTPHSNY